MSTTFREIAHGSSEYRDACFLRDALLRAPLGMDLFEEDLAAEASCRHIAGFGASGQLVAYLQFKPHGENSLKMLQVVVSKSLQGSGVGRGLIEFSEGIVRESGFEAIILHAREEVVGFYEALGYQREGERFVELGIPHFSMRKDFPHP